MPVHCSVLCHGSRRRRIRRSRIPIADPALPMRRDDAPPRVARPPTISRTGSAYRMGLAVCALFSAMGPMPCPGVGVGEAVGVGAGLVGVGLADPVVPEVPELELALGLGF